MKALNCSLKNWPWTRETCLGYKNKSKILFYSLDRGINEIDIVEIVNAK